MPPRIPQRPRGDNTVKSGAVNGNTVRSVDLAMRMVCRPLKLLGRRRPRSVPTPRASPLLRKRSPDRHGRGADYSIALVERLSAFFIMLIGFEWVRPRLTPGT